MQILHRLGGLLQPVLSSGHRRHLTLDGIRGSAAIVVILVHAASSIGPIDLKPRCGFLAVDLFFLLSGFVLAARYDEEFLQGLKPVQFVLARLVRLYPLFVLGLTIGILSRLIASPQNQFLTGGAMTGHEVGIATLLNLFMLPAPDSARDHFIFPFDLPAWSLFFELWVANVGFAFLWRGLQGMRLALVICVLAITTLACAKFYNSFEFGDRWETFDGGFIRVALSFLIGVAVARVHATKPPSLRLPSWLIIALVPILLFAPVAGAIKHIYEAACILLIFPALIYLGAEAAETNQTVSARIGDGSYAAYAIHMPLLSLLIYVAPWLVEKPSELNSIGFVIGIFCLAIPLAYFYDAPVRKGLQRLLRRPSRFPAPPAVLP